MRSALALMVALVLASPAAAQEREHDERAEHAEHMEHMERMEHGELGDPVAGVTWLYETVEGWLVASAEQASQELFDYRPTDEVRTFGQILGHVANAQYMFCSQALGEENPSQRNLEEVTSNAEMVRELRASFEYCDRAYAMDGMRALENAQVFGQERTRLFALEFNAAHDFEHYGNLVTYMRANGLVPPSSQGGM